MFRIYKNKQNPLRIIQFKRVNFMVCELYLNFVLKVQINKQEEKNFLSE